MVISIQTLDDASGLMTTAVLVDLINIYSVGPVQTTGTQTSRALTKLQTNIPGLVQTTVLQNAVESQVVNTYSVKVPRGIALTAGLAVKVVRCVAEPGLVGKTLLLDKVSQNGLALLKKAVASDFHAVDQQGKEGL